MEFKNTLSFIDPATIRSGSFYDPDPKSHNFQHFSFRDESPYDKGLSVLKAYPEAPIARYKDSIDNEKETSIVVSSKVLGVMAGIQQPFSTVDTQMLTRDHLTYE